MDYRRPGGRVDVGPGQYTAERTGPKAGGYTGDGIFQDPNGLAAILQSGPKNGEPGKYNGYANCADVVDSARATRVGSNLDDDDEEALIALDETL